MRNKNKSAAALSAILAVSMLAGCSSTFSPAAGASADTSLIQKLDDSEADNAAREPLNAEVKPATDFTAQENAKIYKLLDFNDKKEKKNAEKGFITKPEPLVIKTKDGKIVWTSEVYDFVRDSKSPDSANPSLWRNTQLCALYGLFEVKDGIYQVRGYDISNITFVRGDKGWIVFDCGTAAECSAAALELFREKFPDAKISAVVISHAHIDHYGGVGGIVSAEELADRTLPLEKQIASGKTLLIVPEGFEKAVMEENVFAGNAMKRRANFQYGTLLTKGEQGSLSVGIGLATPDGTTSYLAPTFEVTEDVFETTVDGVEMVFQLTPGTESPAEMNTYLPQYKALWMAENCTGTMHNIYTLRGAEIRDANAWAQYIMEARELFKDAEVTFQSHNWPHWGKENVSEYLLNTAAVYKFISMQTLQYINEGYTSTEIADMIELPAELEKVWYTRQYYGTLKHNVKAVYQKYMGWYDANPVHLDELTPSEYAKKMVEYLGSTEAVLNKAREDFDKGEYQWVAQLTNMLVFADPDNTDARYLCADALEQLGYQAESGAWRNAYLNAAAELRHGTDLYPETIVGGTGATAQGMSAETMFDYLAINFDSKKGENVNLKINFEITDDNEQYLVEIKNGVLLYTKGAQSDSPDATIKTRRIGILGITLNNEQIMNAAIESKEGSDVIKEITDNLAKFEPYFNIIEP